MATSVPARPPAAIATSSSAGTRRLLLQPATNHRPRVCRLCQKAGCLDVTEATFDLAGESYLLRDAYSAFASLIGSSVAASLEALHVCFECTNELVAAYTFLSKVSAAEERLGTVLPVIVDQQQQQQQQPDQVQQQQHQQQPDDGRQTACVVSESNEEEEAVVDIAEQEQSAESNSTTIKTEFCEQRALQSAQVCEEESHVAFAQPSDQSPQSSAAADNESLVSFEPMPSHPDPDDQHDIITSRTPTTNTTTTTIIPSSAEQIDCTDELDYLDHDMTEYIEEDEPADPAETCQPTESVAESTPARHLPHHSPYPEKLTRHPSLKRPPPPAKRQPPAKRATLQPHPTTNTGPASLTAMNITSDLHTVLVPQYRLHSIDLATRPEILQSAAAADGFRAALGPEATGSRRVRTLVVCARRLAALGLHNLATCDAVYTADADVEAEEAVAAAAAAATAADADGAHGSAVYYICTYCPKAFTTVLHLAMHTRKNHACHMCLGTFEQVGELHQHLRRDHPSGRSECALCSRSFSGNSILRNHMRQVHGLVLPMAWTLLREATLPAESRSKIVEEEAVGVVEVLEELEEEEEVVLEEELVLEELLEEGEVAVLEDGREFDDLVEVMEEEEEEVRDGVFECIEEVL